MRQPWPLEPATGHAHASRRGGGVRVGARWSQWLVAGHSLKARLREHGELRLRRVGGELSKPVVDPQHRIIHRVAVAARALRQRRGHAQHRLQKLRHLLVWRRPHLLRVPRVDRNLHLFLLRERRLQLCLLTGPPPGPLLPAHLFPARSNGQAPRFPPRPRASRRTTARRRGTGRRLRSTAGAAA